MESSLTWPISKEKVAVFPTSYEVLLSGKISPSPVLITIRSDPSVLELYAVSIARVFKMHGTYACLSPVSVRAVPFAVVVPF